MKLLHIINFLSVGGAERLLSQLLPLLNVTPECSVEVLVLRDVESDFAALLAEKGIVVHSLSLKSVRNPLAIFRLYKFIASYDIVHVHLFPSIYWVALASMLSRDSGPILVATEHNTHNRRRRFKLFRWIEKKIYGMYDAVVSISQQTDKNLRAWLEIQEDDPNFLVIENGIPVSDFATAIPYQKYELCQGASSKTPIVCMVARFSKQKDQATLIRSISRCSKDVRLLLVGEGNCEEERKLVEQLGLAEQVCFLGNRNDVPRILKTSDIVVLSSHWEGFGLSAVEGMAAGKPTVVSNVEGVGDIVAGVGIVFPRGDSRELQKQLEKLLDDSSHYATLSQRCRDAAEKYDIKLMCSRHLNLYLSLMKLKKSKVKKVTIVGSKLRDCLNFRLPLMLEFVQAGYKVYAVTPEGSDNDKAILKKHGISFVPVEMKRTGVNPFADILLLLRFLKVYREIRPTITLSYTIKPVIYSTIAAWMAKVPVKAGIIAGAGYAYLENSSKKQRVISAIVSALYWLSFRTMDLVFFQNKDDQKEFGKLFSISDHKSLVTNGTGVDVAHYSYSPVSSDVEEVVFLLIARLIREKGIEEYISAARQIKKQSKNAHVRFQLLGAVDDNPNSYASNEVSTWVKEGIIEYLGTTTDVRPFLKNCSAFVLPSFYREGVPRSILEALSTGRAVITTDNVGCRETVTPGKNGYLVPVRDVSSIVDAMQSLIDCPQELVDMGKAGRKIAEEKFDIKLINSVIISRTSQMRI